MLNNDATSSQSAYKLVLLVNCATTVGGEQQPTRRRDRYQRDKAASVWGRNTRRCMKQVLCPPLQHKARNPGNGESCSHNVGASKGSEPAEVRPTRKTLQSSARSIKRETLAFKRLWLFQTVGNRALQASRCRATMNRSSLHYLHAWRLLPPLTFADQGTARPNTHILPQFYLALIINPIPSASTLNHGPLCPTHPGVRASTVTGSGYKVELCHSTTRVW